MAPGKQKQKMAPVPSVEEKVAQLAEEILKGKAISGRKLMERFFTLVPATDDSLDQPTQYRCHCGTVRTQRARTGYTNLKQHVQTKHPEWIRDYADELVSAKERRISPWAAEKRAKQAETKAAAMKAVAVASKAAAISKKRTATALKEEDGEQQSAASAAYASDAVLQSRPSFSDTSSDDSVQADCGHVHHLATGTSSRPLNGPSALKKRAGYISWDEYFMSVAFLSAMRSKDPSTQVGACIVNTDKKIVGIGYNGFPNGCSDDTLPWARSTDTNDPLETKYPFVCHAEMNAILNKNSSDLRNCTIYVALFPCNECAKLIIQSGIRHIVYLSDKYHGDWKFEASRRLLAMAGITMRQHVMASKQIVIDFTSIL